MEEKFSEIISLLKKLGLTEYEARAYFFLVIHGSLTANELCKISDVPYTRIYDVLSSLESKGLVSLIPSKPKMYMSTPPSMGLNILIKAKEDKMKEEINSMKKIAKSISEKLTKVYKVVEPEEKTFSFGVVRGSEGLDKLIYSSLRSSEREALIFAGDLSWLEPNIQVLRIMKKKGVDIKILADILPKNKKFVDKVRSFGVAVKQKPKELGLRGFVLDGKILYVSKKFLIKGWKKLRRFGFGRSSFREDYWGFVTEHEPLVIAMKDYFYHVWNKV